MKNDDVVERIAAALKKQIPLLTQYSPDGWRDFRDGNPSSLRYGLIVRTTDSALPRSSIQFGASIGSRTVAFAINGQLTRLVPAECFSSAPFITEDNDRFTVEFSLDRRSLDELLLVLDPAPERPFPALGQVRVTDDELLAMQTMISDARKLNLSWASVPCGMLGVLIREVRAWHRAEEGMQT